MEKQKPKKTNASDVASEQPLKETPETPEQMIRSLQGVFCKGRYRSWIFTQGKKNE